MELAISGMKHYLHIRHSGERQNPDLPTINQSCGIIVLEKAAVTGGLFKKEQLENNFELLNHRGYKKEVVL